MLYLVIGTISALISGLVASGKGRSAFGFGMLGFFCPFVGVIVACCVSDAAKAALTTQQAPWPVQK